MTNDMQNVTTENMDDLFRFIDSDTISSEKITAPRYSYWRSVFRVFFRKKSSLIMLILLVIILLVSFIMPAFWSYDPWENVTVASTYNLSPVKAMRYFGGFSLKWMLGTGSMGNSIFYGIIAGARTSLLLAKYDPRISLSEEGGGGR